jgi:WhiB family transcriptional regulator, redox-sensing transcriptional regulator
VTVPEPGQLWANIKTGSRYRIDRVSNNGRVSCEQVTGQGKGRLISFATTSFTGPNQRLAPADTITPKPDTTPDWSWTAHAACLGLDTEDFYPLSTSPESAEPVLRICRSCPVRQECYDMAIRTNDRYGIWGGTTAESRIAERNRERRREKAFR